MHQLSKRHIFRQTVGCFCIFIMIRLLRVSAAVGRYAAASAFAGIWSCIAVRLPVAAGMTARRIIRNGTGRWIPVRRISIWLLRIWIGIVWLISIWLTCIRLILKWRISVCRTALRLIWIWLIRIRIHLDVFCFFLSTKWTEDCFTASPTDNPYQYNSPEYSE